MELFLLFVLFIGILVASFQDLKKREVDNWINFFILILGLIFVIFYSVLNKDYLIFLNALFCLGICVILANMFYYGRIFAGGDAKLMIALFVLFISNSIQGSFFNILYFIFFLLISGSIWGLCWSLFFYIKDFSAINEQIKIEFKNKYVKFGFILDGLFVILSLVESLFFLLFIFLFIIIILFSFAKAIEKVSMIKQINAKNLREGDWLAKDVKTKGKVIRYCWEGLSKEQIKDLIKNNKKVYVKEGIAFVPAFLIAFILYIFKENIFEWFFRVLIG